MPNKKQFFQKYKAFTLMELIVTISIILIITSISWATLNNSSKSSDVNNVCNQVAAKINKARNYALTGKIAYENDPAHATFVPLYSVARIRDKDDDSFGPIDFTTVNIRAQKTNDSVDYNYCDGNGDGDSTVGDCERTPFTNGSISASSQHTSFCYTIPDGKMSISSDNQCPGSSSSEKRINIISGSATATLVVNPSAAYCE